MAELRSFLGLVNYYGKFLANLATTAVPLYNLVKRMLTGHRASPKRQHSRGKDLLQSSDLLLHLDSEESLILACDALPYGLGAVLSHWMQDGSKRPIAFPPHTPTSAERKYSQLDKEA